MENEGLDGQPGKAPQATGALSGLRVLDLSRILAGPSCAQILGDLGAEVIKVEKPGAGDDTRQWGPPFLKTAAGGLAEESAYYLCANRNKRSLAIDFTHPEGRSALTDLAARSDVLIENYKPGVLARHGLDYATLQARNPDLVYCSITGFGQDGPYAARGGYDFLLQGMGGIMSISGEPDGAPMKTGVGITDVMTGMYAAVAILAALNARRLGHGGQYIDLALFDVQVSWLVNAGCNYLLSGQLPARYGNAHPNIVPYDVFPAADGHFILAVGNDAQFRKFCALAQRPDLAVDARFSSNPARVENRARLTSILQDITRARPVAHWLSECESLGVPVGPVNNLAQVFADPQSRHRGMRLEMPDARAQGGYVPLIASPLRLSRTPVRYRYLPPRRGEHTREILAAIRTEAEIGRMIVNGIAEDRDENAADARDKKNALPSFREKT
jgi:crotonobetainyl-CoA:carnitine CoA-transferase CaiB-like acyl-CoA transferase